MTRLALDGGTPIRKRPLAPWPYFEEDEVTAATSVLRSGKVNYWTGTEGRKFEEEYAAFVGTKHAIALTNGTVALELALAVSGVGLDDEVITTSRTFIASAACAVMRGARPVCADVDPISQNVTAESIARVATERTKALVIVHLAGWPCDMDPILKLASERRWIVIEDCAQAHGARYKGRPVGSMGHFGAFSFCQDKILTTGGEGGMLVMNDTEMWKRAWALKDHGKDYDIVYHREHSPGFRWLHESFGTNWRLTEYQSAIGRLILRKLPAWVEKRRHLAGILSQGLSAHPALRLTLPSEDLYHSYYKYYLFVRPERLREGWSRDRIMSALNAEGIPCFSGSCSEIYLEKAFPTEWRPKERLPVAKELGETSLMLLVHPTLGEADMRDYLAAVGKVLEAATA